MSTTERMMRNVEPQPRGICRESGWKSKPLKGDWSRVYPTTWRHIHFLQLLNHNVDKYAPSTGEGVLVRTDKLRNI